MTELRADTLGELDVPVPAYDRGAVRAGVLHIGVGGFHRAHQAMVHDRLLAQDGNAEWGLCGVGVLETDADVRDALAGQDDLYTLVLKHADGTLEPRVIGSIVEYLDAHADPDALLDRIADERTRIVSCTVTEGGYTTDNATWALVVDGLRRRRDAGLGGLTILSCDNLEGNGKRAREVVLACAGDLRDWIEAEVTFPSSMVDRITPRTTDEDRADVAERFDIEDRWPVVCEPWFQWVLEDDFAAGRPPYEDAGVQVVDDVEPYELMKLRLLNAGHQALAHLAHLLGFTLVHDAAQDEALAAFVAGYMAEEGEPTLPAVPGVDLADYRASLLERFANPAVRDTIDRLRAEASDRIPRWLVPVIEANLAAGRSVAHAAVIVAAWAVCAAEGGLDDRRADALTARARDEEDDLAFLRDQDLFGGLVDDERFTGPYLDALRTLRGDGGARAVLTRS